ncbi:urease accessory protein UreD [Roseobacter sinensis]|uniref:Urease accessory protein UreD n=1 Tax=Roseobacter sinensis TaxID=2931391 RepID=A0ABT3BL54_9RHOB|nr:urease accessory protein UreD [Roseobacter sp. WL0113]MCV3274312.1 urease accessory protein UreD [Roseobacter sp. WL0113]
MQSATLLDQPRAIGSATVSSKRRDGHSCLDDLHQAGALKVVFPRVQHRVEGILVNTAGGVTGGDRFDISARAGAGSRLTLTTQAAERAYRAQPHQVGRIRTRLSVDEDAELLWLPQETILYDGSALSRRLDVDLADTARFLMVEPVLFGRRAMGEGLHDASFRDRIDIRRQGVPIYRDGVLLKGDVEATLDRPAIGGGARAMANLILVSPEAEGARGSVRALIGETGGASLLQPGVLAMRLLACDGFELRQRLVPVLDRLTHNTLPTSWRL